MVKDFKSAGIQKDFKQGNTSGGFKKSFGSSSG